MRIGWQNQIASVRSPPAPGISSARLSSPARPMRLQPGNYPNLGRVDQARPGRSCACSRNFPPACKMNTARQRGRCFRSGGSYIGLSFCSFSSSRPSNSCRWSGRPTACSGCPCSRCPCSARRTDCPRPACWCLWLVPWALTAVTANTPMVAAARIGRRRILELLGGEGRDALSHPPHQQGTAPLFRGARKSICKAELLDRNRTGTALAAATFPSGRRTLAGAPDERPAHSEPRSSGGTGCAKPGSARRTIPPPCSRC